MKQDIKRALKFLQEHRALFGFADYSIKVEDKRNVDSESVARAEVDWLDRELTIVLYKQYFAKETDWQNILIHELVHALLGRARAEAEAKSEKIYYFEEEKCVNIITDALMQLKRKR